MIRLLALLILFVAVGAPAYALPPKQISITISYTMKDIPPNTEYVKVACALFKNDVVAKKAHDYYGDVVLDHSYTLASGETSVWKKGEPAKNKGSVTVDIPIGEAKASVLPEAHGWGCGLYFDNIIAGKNVPPSENSKFTNWVSGKYP